MQWYSHFHSISVKPILKEWFLESAPVPGGDSSHFLGTDYMPGLVLGALYLIHHCQPPQEAGMMTLFHY